MDVSLQFEILEILLGLGHLLVDALHTVSVLGIEEVTIILAMLKKLDQLHIFCRCLEKWGRSLIAVLGLNHLRRLSGMGLRACLRNNILLHMIDGLLSQLI